MNLLELKHLYNTLNKKLLIYGAIKSALESMSEEDVNYFLSDPTFFNPLLTYTQNKKIKQKIKQEFENRAKSKAEPHKPLTTPLYGDRIGQYCYCREHDGVVFYPNRLRKKYDIYSYEYKMTPTKCITFVKVKTTCISQFASAHTPATLFAYVYDKHSDTFHKDIQEVQSVTKTDRRERFRLIPADPAYNKFDELQKILQDIPEQAGYESILVFRGGEVFVDYVIRD